jgi:hypothetical protein
VDANLNQSGSTDTTAILARLHLSPGFRYIRRSYGATGDGPKDYNVAELSEALPDRERVAYARLFAAAPDMLAALKQMRTSLNGRPGNFDAMLAAHRAIDAAIARAEGWGV